MAKTDIRCLYQFDRDDRADTLPRQHCTKEEAIEISLAENSQREDMHPVDKMEAYPRLIDAGRTVPDVAARFGVSELVARQRRRLARLSQRILEELRADAMNLAQALAVSDDHAAQERAWFEAPHTWGREPRVLRQALTIADGCRDRPARQADRPGHLRGGRRGGRARPV